MRNAWHAIGRPFNRVPDHIGRPLAYGAGIGAWATGLYHLTNYVTGLMLGSVHL